MQSLYSALPGFARRAKTPLDPNWVMESRSAEDLLDDADALRRLADRRGWPAPEQLAGKPRPNAFPLLLFVPDQGWMVAECWASDAIVGIAGGSLLGWSNGIQAWRLALPAPVRDPGRKRALGIFVAAMLRRKHVFLAAIAATVVVNLLAVITGLYSMQIYDRVIPLQGYATLWALAVGVVIALLLDFALRVSRALLIEHEAQAIDLDVSDHFFAHAQSVRLDARPPGVGTMAAQLRGLETVRGLLSSGSLFVVADLPFALFFILMVFAIGGGTLVLVPLLAFPVSLALAALLSAMIRRDSARALISSNRKNGLLVETFDAAETLKANGGGWFMRARWNQLLDDIAVHEDRVKRWSAISQTLFQALQQLCYVLMLTVGAVEVAEHRLTSGALIACSIIAGRINGPLMAQLPGLIVQASYARSSLSMLDALLELPGEANGDECVRPDAINGPIALQYARFAYAQGRDSIDIAALSIRPGERVAVIGGVGSGKSTLLRLVAGLYAPQQGCVTLDGLDVRQVADDALRRDVGYLAQDYRLLNGTLRDNLVLGMADPGDEALLAAAQATGLIATVSRHPKGLALEIAEGGHGLSGGQRTLAGLTRLLLRRPRIWLLDEPTANLDQAAEMAAMHAVAAALRADDTLVLVTHRMTLLPLVERVIVMRDGHVALDGPRETVLAQLRAAAARPQPADVVNQVSAA